MVTYRPLEFERVYLSICEVAYTPFDVQGDDTMSLFISNCITKMKGEGPSAMVKAICFDSRGTRGSSPALAFKFLARSLAKMQYCVDPPWSRGSVLGLRPSWLKFRIRCLECSVISFISKVAYPRPIPFISFHYQNKLEMLNLGILKIHWHACQSSGNSTQMPSN